jgi:roadblock/LC7 domain-containing protein
LNGTGDPNYTYSWKFIGGKWVKVPISDFGGKDKINGNIYVDGDVWLREQSQVNPPVPNNFGLEGDVDATGDIDVDVNDGASIAGDANEHCDPMESPDLLGMNYAVNNTHNVSQIFAGISSGYPPTGSGLEGVFVKNPTDRSTECGITAGDDYFFEPASGFVTGGPYSGDTPVNAGIDRVYYVDGDVWVHSKPTYGFKMTGKATIVATGNIHICDNLQYADANVDMLGMVALGNYDEDGDLVSGGNVYFGDPGYGNMAVFSGMMFAANNFLYNTDPLGSTLKEPDSGFTVTGNFTAINEVSIDRDWYTNGTERRPARYDPETDKWYDSGTKVELTTAQIGTMKHYRTTINYDDRVRSQSTQPPGLPRGVGLIFEGLTNWEELP